MAKAPPMIQSSGTGPQKRLSSEEPRLSPIMKYSPAGIVIVFGKSQPPPGLQAAVKGSSASSPLRMTCPPLTLTVSPGPATTRLMKLTSSFRGTDSGQTESGEWATPQRWALAPTGGWKTTTSPTLGLENECPMRLTSTRWPLTRVGIIEPLGIR